MLKGSSSASEDKIQKYKIQKNENIQFRKLPKNNV